ncbi:FixH family protein [Oceanicella actignis]|uniref:FixH family protein n=1 Tax=Oceanicella actignis TaxID=1189325 RepID=UPI0011E89F26|nr:FixH family protein [Oceanicella actignis]TYO88186.1 nitrogen fixation protein FixH [Oceanicella actignis]
MNGRDAPPRGGRPLTGRKVLAIFVGAFAVIIGVNVYMMTRAIEGFPGLVVDSPWVAGQNFEARRAAQEALGWRAETSWRDGALLVRMRGADGAPVAGLNVQARVGRPATNAEDRVLDLAETAEGYRAELPLAPGAWRVEVHARGAAEADYRATAQILVPIAEGAR